MSRSRDEKITARIVQKASLGETKNEIARELGISPITVHNHLRPLRAEFTERVNRGEDPFGAWTEILTSLLISAGTIGAFFACMKLLEEIQKIQQKQMPSIKMEKREDDCK